MQRRRMGLQTQIRYANGAAHQHSCDETSEMPLEVPLKDDEQRFRWALKTRRDEASETVGQSDAWRSSNVWPNISNE